MRVVSVSEWGYVFLGLIGMAIILGCAWLLIRKLFGKRRHGEKNKSQRGPFGGLKGLFKGGGAGVAPDTSFAGAPGKVRN